MTAETSGLSPILAAFAVTAGLAAVHVFGGRLRLLSRVPRSRWLSAAGGTSVAYVFLHLLPEAEHFAASFPRLGGIGRPVYVFALLGVVAFYGLERFALRRGGDEPPGDNEVGRGEKDGPAPPPGVFWIHVGSFGLYNALIGYLLVRESVYGPGELALFALAMGTHFLVNDVGLREHHRELYRSTGRWILAGAAFAGWGVGVIVPLPAVVTGALFGFLCGATVLNILKEELPAQRESRFWAFALGAALFAALLLALPTEESEREASSATREASP